MNKLIPLDAAIAACEYAWTHTAAIAALRAIPAIDPAAIREAALEACTIIDDAVKGGHDNLTGLILHLLSAVEPARRALALIGEKK